MMTIDKKLIPTLRFPQFSGEWEVKRMGDLYTFFSTNSYSRDKMNYDVENVYNIHYGDIHTKFSSLFILEKENVPYLNLDVSLHRIKKESFVREGDLVIADASENYDDIGKTIEIISLSNKKVLAGLHTFLARRTSFSVANLAIGYISFYFKNQIYKKQVFRIAQGTKVLSLSASRVNNLKINLPTLPEQEKIASFLSSIDRKVELLKAKKEQLEQYKKGMMQQLFAQTIRFKDQNGKQFPEWQEKRLGEVLVEPKQIAVANPIDFELITVKLYGKGIELTGRYPNITKKGRPYYMRFKEEILIGKQNFHNGSIGVVGDIVANKICSNAILSFNVRKNILVNYCYYYLSRASYYKRVDSIIGGTGQKEISKSEFQKLKINLPSLPEQQKIADFLSAIDRKIEGVGQQMAQTELFKKAMLQQLFV